MSRLSATTARVPPGPTGFANVVRKCTKSKKAVMIDLDITRVRDNYKIGVETGNGIDFRRELVFRYAQDNCRCAKKTKQQEAV